MCLQCVPISSVDCTVTSVDELINEKRQAVRNGILGDIFEVLVPSFVNTMKYAVLTIEAPLVAVREQARENGQKKSDK